jgi:hypothetical protein
MQTRSAPPELRDDQTVNVWPCLTEAAPLAGPTNGAAQAELAGHDRYPRHALVGPHDRAVAERSSGAGDRRDADGTDAIADPNVAQVRKR